MGIPNVTNGTPSTQFSQVNFNPNPLPAPTLDGSAAAPVDAVESVVEYIYGDAQTTGFELLLQKNTVQDLDVLLKNAGPDSLLKLLDAPDLSTSAKAKVVDLMAVRERSGRASGLGDWLARTEMTQVDAVLAGKGPQSLERLAAIDSLQPDAEAKLVQVMLHRGGTRNRHELTPKGHAIVGPTPSELRAQEQYQRAAVNIVTGSKDGHRVLEALSREAEILPSGMHPATQLMYIAAQPVAEVGRRVDEQPPGRDPGAGRLALHRRVNGRQGRIDEHPSAKYAFRRKPADSVRLEANLRRRGPPSRPVHRQPAPRGACALRQGI